MRKGQAGLDFLMTYGWALLLIVLVVGALFALGIFDIGSFTGSRASGFSQVGVTGWSLAPNGTLSIKFRNQVGSPINVTAVNSTYASTTVNYGTQVNIANGQQSGSVNVGAFGTQSPGSSYSVSVKITYMDLNTGFNYTDAGTLTGKVS
jgi:hypothetical protein